ncbi:hypothetical protein G6M04_16515 [Agrobacterium rhizogenes]|uniref:hypothetical protein n=1 Tax=Rhizobium rhizogenes TaxID=359 RepID=UPI001571947B|nr:hypothetical protein [Rhizobium rhizogenes]NTG48981.1 hypothetical protein [Rhizobium rhizogenes]
MVIMTRDCGEVIVDGGELLRSLRIGVRVPRMFGPRMTLATWLFILAGWVSGTRVVVEIDDGEDSADISRFEKDQRRHQGTPITSGSGAKPIPPRR